MSVPEQAATAAIFGFVLSALALMFGHLKSRDRDHRDTLAAAYQLVSDTNDARVKEVGELSRCMQSGLNGMFVAIKETNADLVRGFQDALRELRPVLIENNAALARAKDVMERASAMRSNGH